MTIVTLLYNKCMVASVRIFTTDTYEIKQKDPIRLNYLVYLHQHSMGYTYLFPLCI